MAEAKLNVRVVFKNRKAARALRFSAMALDELAEDFPYRPEIVKAAKAVSYAMRHIDVKVGD